MQTAEGFDRDALIQTLVLAGNSFSEAEVLADKFLGTIRTIEFRMGELNLSSAFKHFENDAPRAIDAATVAWTRYANVLSIVKKAQDAVANVKAPSPVPGIITQIEALEKRKQEILNRAPY